MELPEENLGLGPLEALAQLLRMLVVRTASPEQDCYTNRQPFREALTSKC